ncbi:MtrB/PioB family decaheme-associated outer membrane protein [Motiliproteus sp. SC1-56]|uniref:MtrB/PioB family decaheme-associated outer membrane protein n=1 Tax=Motiliproteus sp. SC1-56 TaxID=2799565 RepID=UPI001A8F7911|nr:MtrB/PioB family decaheme-associated outer membrane protein [Motiliproteus sp. SC1-56]
MTAFKQGIVPLSACLFGLVAGAATAQDDELEEVRLLSTPSSSVSAGLGYSSDDLKQLGRYNGHEESGFHLLLDFDINQRDDETGTWTRVDGRRVGLSSRSLRYERNRQGQWNYFIEFDQLDARDPYDYRTGLRGTGSDQQRLTGNLRSIELSQERRNFKLGMGRKLTSELDFNLTYRHERKEGERNWGTAASVGSDIQSFFLVEPIDYRTQELIASLDYVTDRLQLQGGYLLSLFDNPTEVVTLDFSSVDPSASPRETATAPDNSSHRFYLDGGYAFTDKTRGSLHIAYQEDHQDEDFYQSNPFNFRDDLGGEVATTRINLGLVSRVLPELTLRGKLRYMDRDDKTPQVQYIITSGRVNQLTSRSSLNGSLDATYRLKPGTTLSGGLEYEDREHSEVDDPNMARRDDNQEFTLHVGARQTLSDTLQGSVKLLHADRDGSGWKPGSGIAEGTLLTTPVAKDFVNSIQFADRERDQIRLMLDWFASEQLSLQWLTEFSQDEYDGQPLGPRDGDKLLLSLDGAYQLNDEWRINGWVSWRDYTLDTSTHGWQDLTSGDFAASYTGSEQTWSGEQRDLGRAIGLGIEGLTGDEIKVGAKLQYSNDDSSFDMSVIDAPSDAQFAPAGSLPTIEYKTLQFRAFAEYPLDDWGNQGLRLDYQYERIENDDWTWNNHTGYDQTRVSQDSRESNHFIGLTYYYRGW